MILDKIDLIFEIKRLSNLLDKQYDLELNFRNHCYLRIAYDNTVNDKWDNVVRTPFVKYANNSQLENALSLLKSYSTNKKLLLEHNTLSLQFRNKL